MDKKCERCDWLLEISRLCFMDQKPRTCIYFKDSTQTLLKENTLKKKMLKNSLVGEAFAHERLRLEAPA